MAYRTAPLENGFSLSEPFMGRRLRTTLPTASVIFAKEINKNLARGKEERQKWRNKKIIAIDIMGAGGYQNSKKEEEFGLISDKRVTGKEFPRPYLVQSGKIRS